MLNGHGGLGTASKFARNSLKFGNIGLAQSAFHEIDEQRRLAAALLENGQQAKACEILLQILAGKPRDSAARLLLGRCYHLSGDLSGAEITYRAGLKFDRGHAGLAIAFANLLEGDGRVVEAERVLRVALESNRRSSLLTIRLARSLNAAGRSQEALRLIGKLAPQPKPDHAVLSEQALALKAMGQAEKALAVYQRAARLYPESAVAHHNLAASQGDLGRFAEAERSATRALANGGRTAQTHLVHARALLGHGKLAEAEDAFREAIRQEPAYPEAHRDLAQLIWMRTEDAAAAMATLDAAIRAHPQHHDLAALRANLLHHAGQPDAAFETLARAVRLHPGQVSLHLAAASMAALCGRTADALHHAELAAALMPGDDIALSGLFAACVASNNLARASAIAESLAMRRPLDQRAWAYQALAWRLTGDARYKALYDYAAFVGCHRMDVPDGWASLPIFLADLAEVLAPLHPFRTHPLDQSLRHGSQATHLLASEHPVIRAFFQSVDGPIRRHLAALGTGADPVRRRNSGRYRFHGAWSVRLRPGGYHTDHIHPEGWLSSACYIDLPEMDGAGQEAWIKFGEPGIPTQPPLGPEHVVRPEPGLLVLFPSYMWHGTVPFTSPGRRLSIAFDLVPA